MYLTRNNPILSSADSARPRKKHVHAECGEPVKGHHRVNGLLICRTGSADDRMTVSTSKASEIGGELWALSQLQPGRLDDLELAMAQSLQLLREARAHGFGSRGIPGTLDDDSSLQRRGAYANPSWAGVAITALETFRELWKHTFTVFVLLLCMAFYFTRNDSPKPSITCTPS
ncbi:hypothetical protein B0H17DRAFT_1187941 [Mycena rosella]|uniref:Uncharacterized protein n=1 Tax=Mycena rosella TaxID=1033263 RepID=A0AAD7FJH6_MYCRO|nr:hypothetical protein B0H17DRAFT_1187941 [Mycena rosella]